MHDIYKQAYAVIVIDADTVTMDKNADFTEIGMRLFLSAWSSRLWTYQEGSLNPRVIVMARNGLIDLDAMIKAQLRRDRTADPPQHNLAEKMIRASVLALGRPQHHSQRSSSIPLLEDGSDLAMLHMARHDGDLDAQKMFHAMSDRTSSRSDNETIIFGATLGLELSDILKAPAERRMVAFLKVLPYIPGNLLFSVGQRLAEPGFRWASKTIIRSNGGYSSAILDHMVPWSEFMTKLSMRSPRPLATLDPNGKGLSCFNPAISLKNVHQTYPDQCLLFIALFDTVYAFHATCADSAKNDVDAESSDRIRTMLDQGKELAIVVPEFDPGNKMTCGSLVEILSKTTPIESVDLESGRRVPTRARFCMTVRFIEKGIGQVVFAAESEDEDSTQGPLEGGSEQERQEMRRFTQYQAEWLWPRFWLID
jgi:hypothetical protein